MAISVHPDKNPDDPNAHEMFVKVSKAHVKLTKWEEHEEEEQVWLPHLACCLLLPAFAARTLPLATCLLVGRCRYMPCCPSYLASANSVGSSSTRLQRSQDAHAEYEMFMNLFANMFSGRGGRGFTVRVHRGICARKGPGSPFLA